jgi:hypothetical protein
MESFPIHALSEADLDSAVEKAGGVRAHTDADRRDKVGADFVLGNTVIELKMLDEEGFDKRGRQTKLAELFRVNQPGRPVVVLDPDLLPGTEQLRYRNIVAEPIKGLIPHAKKQLDQSRKEYPDTTGSVLWIFNNGYTGLDHETLKELAAKRVRQDTRRIDGVIVSGCYYHGDGFESKVLWPCDYVPIRLDHGFREFERLRHEFGELANNYMTTMMQRSEPTGDKFEVRDLVFDVDGVRYVRPAPTMGAASSFYVWGRPRANSSGIETRPPVALIVPGLTRVDHAKIAGVIEEVDDPLSEWTAWERHLASARVAATPTQPLVSIAIDAENYLHWCAQEPQPPSLRTLTHFACGLFNERIRAVLDAAREKLAGGVLPSAYVLALTQEIGQDRANDVSDIAVVRVFASRAPLIRPLLENVRIFHEHAVALAAAYALREGLDVVRWKRNLRHGWT